MTPPANDLASGTDAIALPESMRLVDMREPGGPDVLHLASAPVPAPAPGEILVRVHAAGVNRPDVLQRMGKYPAASLPSPILGLEVAGDVAALGAGVASFAIGESVCALTNGGGYAEYVCVPAGQALRWPKGYGALLAACLPETFFTVWANLFQSGRLVAGESVLLHGGSGGIGTTAIQLARHFGARVLVTAGSTENCKACMELGASVAINYHEQDFAEVVARETDGQGVDVILDIIGAKYFARNLHSLGMDGRLILLGFLGGDVAERVELARIMMRRLVITGSAMRPRSSAEKAAIASDLHARVWPLLDAGRCRPVIADVFPLEQAADAHRRMEAGGHTGKIVLQVRPEAA